MHTSIVATAATAALLLAAASHAYANPAYAWRSAGVAPAAEALEARIAPPPGFARVPAAPDSWAAWLRGLPLKPRGSPVLTYTGAPKWRQDVHVAVIDIDVG